MQFIGDYVIDAAICARLIELHRACDRMGLVKPGRLYTAGQDGSVVDPSVKDSLDVSVRLLPPQLQNEYGLPRYGAELQRCTEKYMEEFPHLHSANFALTESPVIQHYRPGGGFKREHYERANLSTASRILAWMTFLNDVTDAGGTRFVYQDKTFEARAGRTLIWPTEFTHTHVGVVSPSQHKYIITGWLNLVA